MSDKQQQQLYLLVTESTESSFGDRYYKQTVRVVTDKYEQGKGLMPYGLDDRYGSGLLYSNLRFSCQGDEKSRLRTDRDAVYGYGSQSDVEYGDVYRVSLSDARRMVKTIEKIQRGLGKLDEKRGYVRSWGEWLGRVAEAIGCTGMVFEKSPQSQERTGEKYRWHTVGEGVNQANARVYEWQREALEREQARQAREQATVPAAAESEAV